MERDGNRDRERERERERMYSNLMYLLRRHK